MRKNRGARRGDVWEYNYSEIRKDEKLIGRAVKI
jgi:hypothetical protein